jgi:MoaA/NifB/PqqE/SkfB family radical SAM enzyme
MFSTTDIRQLHIEITSKCNAACPQCARNIRGSVVDPLYDQTEIRLDDFRRIFPPEFMGQLTDIFMCGTYGDAIVAQDCLEIWSYIHKYSSNAHTSLHTNGGARSPKWWAQLAEHCRTVWFGIDGLKDTNHLYRQNVDWFRLVENVKGFVGAGGRAVWVMNVFKHNEHQVEEARLIAKELGFAEFIVRKTARFYWPTTGLVSKIPVYDLEGRIKHFLEMPTRPEFLNGQYDAGEIEELKQNDQKKFESGPEYLQGLVEEKRRLKEERRSEDYVASKSQFVDSVRRRYDAAEVSCKALAKREVYLSASGLVWPCCFLSIHEWGHGPAQSQVDQIFQEISGKQDSLNAKKHGLQAVVESPFFQKYVPESWKKKSLDEGKIYSCAYWCQKEDGLFDAESTSIDLKE